MSVNLIKMCRFCLYEEKCEDQNKVWNIFESELDLAEKIRIHIQIKISPDDKIPPYMCTKCADCLMKFHKFLDCSWKSQKVLNELYMLDQSADNAKSDRSKSHLSNEQTVYVYNKEYYVTFNETYVTNFTYFSESGTEIGGSSIKADDNEIKSSKTEDMASDDCNEDSDSDLSSIKENVETKAKKRGKVVTIDENVKKFIGDNTYVCSICCEEFKSFFEYQDHQESHNGQLVFSCTKCDQVFSEREKLVEHDANHKVACQVCNKMVLPKSLTAHLKKHTDLHRCPECNLSHTSKAALEKHVKARHMGQKGLVCHICGKQSSCQSSLNRHLAYHNSERPHQCKHCNFSTKSSSVLKVHMSRKHLGVQQSCEECGKSFKSEISLRQHMKRIHNPRKYVCHVCQKAFVEKHSLDKHILCKHSHQQLYECNACNKEFLTVRQLKEHMHSHRQGGASCPNCGKRFLYKKYLEKHLEKCQPRASSAGENFKDKLCRLKSTISLPGHSIP